MKKTILVITAAALLFACSCAKKGDLLTSPSAPATATPGPTAVPTATPLLRHFGGGMYEQARGAAAVTDGYVIAGTSASFSNGNPDVFVVKTDFSGNPVWQKTYGGLFDDQGFSIEPCTDGGFILGGASYITATAFGLSDLYMVKIDSLGNKQWERMFGTGTDGYYGYSVAQTQDGGYACGGYTSDSGGPGYMVKVDALGNTQWVQHYSNFSIQWYDSMDPTPDGGLVVCGQSAYSYSPCLFKLDSGGVVQWSRNYSDYTFYTLTMERTADSGYILAGSNPGMSPPEGVGLIKVDASGNCVWAKTYSVTGDLFTMDNVFGVMEDNLGNFVVTGYIANYAFVFKTDASGARLWGRTYFGATHDEGNHIMKSPDNNYIVTGTSYTYGMFGDYYIMKLDPALGGQIW